MKLEINKIWTLKLNSGEEVIVKVTAIDQEQVTVISSVSVRICTLRYGIVSAVYPSYVLL